MDNLLALLLAAFPLMGSPGPATLSTAAMGTAFGIAGSLRYLAGIIAGTVSVLLLIATGVTGLILSVPALVGAISIVAAAYILYLAWKIATAPVLSRTDRPERAPSFPGGYILALANPKAFAAIGAVYSQHVLVADNLLFDSVAKLIVLTGVIVIINSAWLVFGTTLAGLLSDPKLGRIANIIFALLLVGSVLLAVL